MIVNTLSPELLKNCTILTVAQSKKRKKSVIDFFKTVMAYLNHSCLLVNSALTTVTSVVYFPDIKSTVCSRISVLTRLLHCRRRVETGLYVAMTLAHTVSADFIIYTKEVMVTYQTLQITCSKK